MDSRNAVSIEVAVAAALGIASGLGSAWAVYSHRLPNDGNYWGLAPTVISLLVYAAILTLRLSKNEPIWKLAVVVVVGLIVLIAVESIPIIMIGCRYDACINL
jgi:hypothetical protein